MRGRAVQRNERSDAGGAQSGRWPDISGASPRSGAKLGFWSKALPYPRPDPLGVRRQAMKGNVKLIGILNDLLADELTAIDQYMVHSEMCANWGYDKLHHAIEHQAIDEMHHAELHIGRIIFLEGQPVVSKLNSIQIGKTVKEIVVNDLNAESSAVKAYNNAIRLAVEVGDNASREMLEAILKDEERHLDWGEQQCDQIEQMGLENYLAMQMTEGKAG
jgi:bacterioferritin